MNQKLMYKVVRVVVNDERVSTNTNVPDSAVVVYKKGKQIFPKLKGSKLFVFETKNEALYFAKGNVNYEVWEVIANNPIQSIARAQCLNGARNYQNFWKVYSPDLFFDSIQRRFHAATRPPQGTYFCDSLWMVRCIKTF
jgi:hypothetical protein